MPQVEHQEGQYDLHDHRPAKACHWTWRLRIGVADKSDRHYQAGEQAAENQQTDVAGPSPFGFHGFALPCV
jgi:hypothetical protein